MPNPSITAKREENKESSKGKIGIEKIVDSLDAVDAQDAARQDHFAAKAAAVTVKDRPVEGSDPGPQAPPGPEVKERPVENTSQTVKGGSSDTGL